MIYSFLLNNISENTASFIVSDFANWLQSELNKHMCKNNGKLFKFSIAIFDEEKFYGIDYETTSLIISITDVSHFQSFGIFFDVEEAVKKCKEVAENFARENNLCIKVEKSGGLANYYTFYRN